MQVNNVVKNGSRIADIHVSVYQFTEFWSVKFNFLSQTTNSAH